MDRIATTWTTAIALVGLASLVGCSDGASSPAAFFDNLMPPEPREVANDALDTYDADKRRNAIVLLSNADWGGEPPYLRLYRLLATDPDPTVRAAALRALGRHGTVEDVSLVVAYLEDENRIVRWEAAKALQRMHHEDAIDPLIERLRDDEDADVRLAAAKALAQYREPRVFQALVGALNDGDFAVVEAARSSLKTLTSRDFGTEPAAWLSWADRTEDLFAEAKAYRYQPYHKSPDLWDRVRFWQEDAPPPPQVPTGMSDSPASQETADAS
jgi:HEAT repeat protein